MLIFENVSYIRCHGFYSPVTLLKLAARCSAAELESLVRTYEKTGAKRGDRNNETEKRFLEWYYDEEGMLVLSARLPADLGAVVVKALDKAVDMRKQEWDDYFENLYFSSLRDDEVSLMQRRAPLLAWIRPVRTSKRRLNHQDANQNRYRWTIQQNFRQ